MWSANPNCTNAEIRTALQKSAQDLGSAQGRDADTGFGLVNAAAALAYLAKNKCKAYLPPSPPSKKLPPPPRKLSPPPKKLSPPPKKLSPPPPKKLSPPPPKKISPPPPKKAPAPPPVALWEQCGGMGGNCNNAAGECRDAAVKRECAQTLAAGSASTRPGQARPAGDACRLRPARWSTSRYGWWPAHQLQHCRQQQLVEAPAS